MHLRIPVMGASLPWVIVADEGLWYPVIDKVAYNSAVLRWSANYVQTNNMLFSDVPTVTKEGELLVLHVNGEEVGSLEEYSGELMGLCYQRFEMEWNKLVLYPSAAYSRECVRATDKIIEQIKKKDMLNLFTKTHKLSRDSQEEVALAVSRLYVYENGGLMNVPRGGE